MSFQHLYCIVLRKDKDIERLEDKKEARAERGRRFQREMPVMEKDLDLAIEVPASCLSRER